VQPKTAEVSEDAEGPLPSPASAIASLAREIEHCLDLKAATKGQYVVKPQVSFISYFPSISGCIPTWKTGK
jgi:hypothetical protein